MKKIICFVLAVMLCLCGCASKKSQYKDYSFDSFDTVTTIIGFEASEEVFKENCKAIKEKLLYYHKQFTIYTRYDGINNLCVINSSEGPVEVDKSVIDLLSFSKDMYSVTGGKTNVAMGNVLSVWHDYRTEGLDNPAAARLPEKDMLEIAAENTAVEDVVIDRENSTITLKNGVTLDVGAIAKGYAVERVAEWMEQSGMTGYVLNVGGNVRTIGEKPSGEKWTVGIENPNTDDEENPYIEYLALSDMSLVTSGSYQRFYVVDGKNYHHIIDPKTLYPAEYFLSVSVLCRDSGYADALSTALFTMPYEEGKTLVEKLDGVEAMWVMPNGEQRYSSGFRNYCEAN